MQKWIWTNTVTEVKMNTNRSTKAEQWCPVSQLRRAELGKMKQKARLSYFPTPKHEIWQIKNRTKFQCCTDWMILFDPAINAKNRNFTPIFCHHNPRHNLTSKHSLRLRSWLILWSKDCNFNNHAPYSRYCSAHLLGIR